MASIKADLANFIFCFVATIDSFKDQRMTFYETATRGATSTSKVSSQNQAPHDVAYCRPKLVEDDNVVDHWSKQSLTIASASV